MLRVADRKVCTLNTTSNPLQIKVLDPATKVCSSLAGTGHPGLKDGPFDVAQFSEPGGLCADPEGNFVFVADTNNHAIRVLDLTLKAVSQVTHTHTCTHTHAHTHKHIRTHTNACTHTHTCTHIQTHTHTNACKDAHSHTNTYMPMHTHMHTHTHAHTNTCTHTHTCTPPHTSIPCTQYLHVCCLQLCFHKEVWVRSVYLLLPANLPGCGVYIAMLFTVLVHMSCTHTTIYGHRYCWPLLGVTCICAGHILVTY